jgi:nucleotide-binding universal stress UspA family protein
MSAEHEGEGVQPSDQIRIERIVAGVDFSAPSIAAACWAREHFAPQADCHIIHALDVPRPPRLLRGAFPSRDEVLTSARAGAAARLDQLCQEEKWGTVTLDVRDGRAEDVIAAAAGELDAHVIIVGEHLHPRGISAPLGSTAEALVRCSPVPVLLARGVADHPPQRILVAVDESQHARAALRWGCFLAGRYGAPLTVFHVFRPVYLGVARSVSGLESSRRM